MGVLSGLEPKEVFQYFEEICRIPHGSYHEEKLSDYCMDFAKEHGLCCFQDELKNVVIIKEAAPGYEGEPPIILQGHLDMVCEKEPDCTIDFAEDGLELQIEGDYVTARGTTLGGDDGIAVAYALALLVSDRIAHPRLEVVLTVSEEVGMEGAAGIDLSMLKGSQLINLDSEEEGIMLAGCAGGAKITCRLPVQYEELHGNIVKLSVFGLIGGHSGTEIHKGRANANLILARALVMLAKSVPYHLVEISGGSKDNAIPRESEAFLAVAGEDVEKAREIVEGLQESLSSEYALTDPRICVTLEPQEMNNDGCKEMLDTDSTNRVLVLIHSLPNGVQSMSADVPGLVETSLNLGVVQIDEKMVALHYAVRSSVGSAKEALIQKMEYIIRGMGGSMEMTGVYPAWEYRRESPLRNKMIDVYEKMYGKKPEIQAIHAGVECGLLSAKIPQLDCISMGPNILSIHTTEEKLSISSTKRVWEYLIEVLKLKID